MFVAQRSLSAGRSRSLRFKNKLISHISGQNTSLTGFCLETMMQPLFHKSILQSEAYWVTEALLLYGCEEGGHVPSVDARVQKMLEKWVRGHLLIQ